jgi:hypothetical protein
MSRGFRYGASSRQHLFLAAQLRTEAAARGFGHNRFQTS